MRLRPAGRGTDLNRRGARAGAVVNRERNPYVSNRRLPNLLIVGVPKAGTGSLFTFLGQHSQICGSAKKEVGYFNHFSARAHSSGAAPPVSTYLEHWSHCRDERYLMEATPSYIYGGVDVIEGIRQVLGTPKIVITLRDPVARLWSGYTYQRTLGNIPHVKSFPEYLDLCERRRLDGTDLEPGSHLNGLSIGFYGEHLEAWLDAFGNDLRVVFVDDLAGEPSQVVAQLIRWLGLDAGEVAEMDLGIRNVTHHARSPLVANIVFSLKRAADRFHLLPPRQYGYYETTTLRDRLRNLYYRVNSGDLPETLDPETRQRVEDLYRDSTRAAGAALEAHGYRDLPTWLRVELPSRGGANDS